MRVLLVEDNLDLSDAISKSLHKAGFAIDAVTTGQDALAGLAGNIYDIVILDRGLPDQDGVEVLRTLRAQKNPVPVLMLTAKDSLSDKVSGLDSGADDYMVKPFEVEELISRLHALLRRPVQNLDVAITQGNISFDTASRQVRINDSDLKLSRREIDLLELLMRSAEKVVAKKSIELRLYSYSDTGSANSIEVLVHRLRKKLIEARADVEIHTLTGIGYMMRSAGKK